MDGQAISSIKSRYKRFSLLHRIQTSSGAHPALYPMGTGALAVQIKNTTSSAKVKNV
jgi:hypothetical protein